MDANGERFAARRSGRFAVLFLVAFGIGFIVGLGVISTGDRGAGIALVVFGGLAEVVIVATVISPNSWFQVGVDRVTLRKGFGKLDVSFADLRRALVLDAEQTRARLRDLLVELTNRELAFDIKGARELNKRYFAFTRYCSVPIVRTQTNAGGPRHIRSVDVKVAGDFVLLERRDGSSLLVAPKDAAGFVAALERRAPALRFVPDDDERPIATASLSKPAGDDVQKKRMRVAVWIYRIAAIPVVFIGVIVFVRGARAGGESPAVVVAPAQDTAHIVPMESSTGDVAPAANLFRDADTYRAAVTVTLPAGASDDVQARRTALRDALAANWRLGVTDSLFAYYAGSRPEGASADQNVDLHTILYGIIAGTSFTVVDFRVPDDASSASAVVDVTMDGLQSILDATVSSYYRPKASH